METSQVTSGRFEEVSAALRLPDEFEVCRYRWPESQARYETEGRDFLSRGFVESTCRFLQMRPDMAAAYGSALAAVRSNDALMRLAWHAHCLLCDMPENRDLTVGAWPSMPGHLGEGGRMFYGYVLLSGTPHLRALHAALGIPEEVTVETLNDVEVRTREFREEHGCWGLESKGWFMNHFRLTLFRLSRLTFTLENMRHDFHAFRRRGATQSVVLAGDGMRFRGDGQFDGADELRDEQGAWDAEYHEDDDTACGHRVSPDGRACREWVELSLKEWRRVVGKGDPVLGVHIHSGDPLEHEACRDSYRRAVAFFPRHFPAHAARAFTCSSWMLDPQLADYLPETSNLVRFLQDWYLLPGPNANGRQTIERVFGKDVTDPLNHPARTTLQKAVVEHMKKGGRWRGQIGLRLFEDVVQG